MVSSSSVMKYILTVLLASAISSCNCTLMAATGYIASSYPFRDYLIESGISHAIKTTSDSQYEWSGFRHAADQGTRVRKALMKNHKIVEKDLWKRKGLLPAEIFWKKKGLAQVPREYANETRMYSERLFGVLNRMDRNTCISRLLCEIGAQPSTFGTMGLKIDIFIRSVPPVTWNSETFPYIEAFQYGAKNGKDICLRYYLSCTYDLNRVMTYLWFFINPLDF